MNWIQRLAFWFEKVLGAKSKNSPGGKDITEGEVLDAVKERLRRQGNEQD